MKAVIGSSFTYRNRIATNTVSFVFLFDFAVLVDDGCHFNFLSARVMNALDFFENPWLPNICLHCFHQNHE